MRQMFAYSANQIVRRLKQDAIIHIDPVRIELLGSARTRRPKNIGILLDRFDITHNQMKGWQFNLLYRNSFVLGDADFSEPVPLAHTRTYENVRDFVEDPENYRNTRLYEEMRQSIADTGKYVFKKLEIIDEAGIRWFFEEYWGEILRSLRRSGYDAKKAPDIGKCYIRSDGALVKGENGRHRLAFAKCIGLKNFPLQVFGASETWFREEIGERMDLQRLRQKLGAVEDLYS